jgi:DNA-binding beta-propeller fold protein YncE
MPRGALWHTHCNFRCNYYWDLISGNSPNCRTTAMNRILDKIKRSVPAALRPAVVSFLLSAVWVAGVPAEVQAEVQTSFLYRLSNFSGPVPSNWATISVDRARDEIYVTDGQSGIIRIYNDRGMEVYRFGDDWNSGSLLLAAAARNDGNILVLTRKFSANSIVLCNFRGEFLADLALQGLPPDFSGFSPTDMVYRNRRLYLLDNNLLRLAVTDSNGYFMAGYDLGALLQIDENKRMATQLGGFSVDHAENIYFTVPVLFTAFKLSPDGKLASFGKPGSAPGRFNNLGGIVADDQGYIYVADRLKSVVIIFDKDFKFLNEFGYRGRRPYNLIAPNDLDLDAAGRLYVSQLASIGVSVFKIIYQ